MNRRASLITLLGVTAAVGVAACEFRVGTGQGAQTPGQGSASTAAQTPTATPTLQPPPASKLPGGSTGFRIRRVGPAAGAQPTATAAGSATPAPTASATASPTAVPTGVPTGVPSAIPSSVPTEPPAAPTITAATVFGGPGAANFRGTLFYVPEGTAKFPDLTKLTAQNILYLPELNIAAKSFDEGLPADKRATNFAIRYESPLVVVTDATYEFRLVADDAALFYIDDTLIVDNDGSHAAQEKKGAAHLIPGAHYMRVDYLQGSTKTIALQLMVKSATLAEKPLGAQL
jgi:hypothetical protein